jgi:hypothetical protein
MEEIIPEDALKVEIERKHYARAALVAASLNRPAEEVRDLRLKALWQISAVSRNAPGTSIFGHEYGLTKDEVADYLRKRAEEEKEHGAYKALEPCYDQITGKYLPFEVWLDQLLKQWEKLAAPQS